MKKLYIANTLFEDELASGSIFQNSNSLKSNGIAKQLEFLPMLIAGEKDFVYTSKIPDEKYSSKLEKILKHKLPTLLHDLSSIPDDITQIIPWGNHQFFETLANKNHIPFSQADLSVVKEVNSKEFSFGFCPNIPHRYLTRNAQDLKEALSKGSFPKVVKSAFGVSSRGNRILHDCKDKWISDIEEGKGKISYPLIVEPWLERKLDFSSQWYLHEKKGFELLGLCKLHNNSRGQYEATSIGSASDFFSPFEKQVKRHIDDCQQVLKSMQEKSYFGHLGIDAMVYGDGELCSVVEINARQTMSLMALLMQKKHFPDQSIQVAFKDANFGTTSLLPEKVSGEKPFKKNLFLFQV